jgi:hypothetical protein
MHGVQADAPRAWAGDAAPSGSSGQPPVAVSVGLAGVMGMNFKVGLFDNTSLFWVVLAVIVAVASLTLGIAKLRSWI